MLRTACISLALLLLGISQALADVTVIVRREAEAGGNYVRVCDIARVEGPRDQAAEVAKIVLGPTPQQGETREITRWDIESRLYEMGIGVKVSFSGNDMVRVFGNGAGKMGVVPEDVRLANLDMFFERRPETAAASFGGEGMTASAAAAAMSPAAPVVKAPPPAKAPVGPPLETMAPNARERLGMAVSHYLAGRYNRPDVEVETRVLSVSDAVPYTAHEIRVREAVNGQAPGKASFRVLVRDEADAAPREIMVSADTEVYALAPVAARPLYKGEEIGPRDVRVAKVKMVSGKAYLPPNLKSAFGREPIRNIPAGEPLLASEVVIADAVKRGEVVQNIATDNAFWEVRSSGKAMGDGKIGDVITVEDTGTKAKYQARVTGRKTVSIVTNTRK